jgi:hypothetical protein
MVLSKIDALTKLTDGKNETKKINVILEDIERMHCEFPEIRKLLDFIKKQGRELFLCLRNPEVEKTSGYYKQHLFMHP